jgi:hypothetical protein
MIFRKPRQTVSVGLLLFVAACGPAPYYEADADRSACSPDYGSFYDAAGNLPVRCSAQTTPPY